MKVTHKKPVTEYEYNKIKSEHQAQINRFSTKYPRVDTTV